MEKPTAQLTPAERRFEAFFFGLLGSTMAGLIIWTVQSNLKSTSVQRVARFTKEWGKGMPRSDIERAMNHYGITEEEYIVHPEYYPLPGRGSGLN